jgi:ABC-type lipoprotein release transport system permease subunit
MLAWGRVRRHVWATVAIAGAIAIVTATVLAVGAGARRTGTAPDRYTASIGGNVDGLIQQNSGPPLTDRIAALPGVKKLAAYTFMFGGLESAQHKVPETLVTFAGERPLTSRVVAGRDPSPRNPHEFVVDTSFTKATGARVGDHFSFGSISRAQIASGKGFSEEPKGAAFDATLVGIISSPDEINSEFTVAVFPKSLLREDIGFVATVMQVRLRPGVSASDLRRELDTLPNHAALSLEPGVVITGDIRQAVDAQATGLWVLAVVLAVAALVALGQLLTRHVQRADRERDALLSVGLTRRQREIESLLVAAVPATAGVVIGAVLALIPSGSFPTGFSRALEPHTGASADVVTLAGGAGLLLLGVLVWLAIAIGHEERAYARPAAAPRTRSLLARVPTTAAVIGARFAVTRGNRRRSVHGTILALTGIIALVVGSATFAASLNRLVTDRARFGQNYTFALGDDGSDHSPAQLRAAIAPDPNISGLMLLSEGSGRVVGSTASIGLVRVESVKGNLAPRVLSGRLPTASDEIMLGRLSAATLKRHVGDELRLRGAKGEATLHVVGIGIVPGVGGVDGVGQGGVVDPTTFARINGESDTNVAAIATRAGASAREVAGRIGLELPPGGGEELPPAISNVERVRRVPIALAALLGVLALMTMLHALYMSIRSRRVDVAIMKGLGADRLWITRVVHAQATLLTVIPLVIGLPLGVLAGSRLFQAFVDRIGALPDATIPTVALVGIVLGSLTLANLVALLPARRARHQPTAMLLRAE